MFAMHRLLMNDVDALILVVVVQIDYDYLKIAKSLPIIDDFDADDSVDNVRCPRKMLALFLMQK